MCLSQLTGLLFVIVLHYLKNTSALLTLTGMQAVALKSFIEHNSEVSNQLFPRRKDCRISAEEMKNKIEFSDDVYPEMNAKAKNFFLLYIELLDNRKEGKITPLITLHCNMQYLFKV